MHNPCAVIPVYNHETAVPAVVDALLAARLPCVLVDDASSPACRDVLQQLSLREHVFLIRLAVNEGKGGAVMAGLREAARLGFTHALQVDADGQHDLRDVATFLQVSQHNPDALIWSKRTLIQRLLGSITSTTAWPATIVVPGSASRRTTTPSTGEISRRLRR